MILPKTDISIMDVRNVLGYPSTDLGTLCSCENINPWSKYKPLLMTTDAVNWVLNGNKLINYDGWEKGNLGTYGFTFPTSSTIDSIINGAKWVYNPPTGGTRQPYILGSFAGYNSNAVPFLMTPYKENELVEVNRTTNTQFGIGAAISLSSDSQIGFDDFADSRLNNAVFCAIFKTGTYTPTVVNANGTLVNGNTTILVPLSQSPFTVDRDWDVYLALRSSATSGAYYPIPWDNDHHYHFKLNIVSESPFDIDCTKFSQWLTGPWSNISDFAFSTVGGTQGYYPTRGPLYFQMNLTTKGSSNVQIVQSQLRVQATVFGGSTETNGVYMYDSDGSQISNVIIYPNQTTSIKVGTPYMVQPNTAVSSGTKVYSLIKFTYNGEIIFSCGLNLTYA